MHDVGILRVLVGVAIPVVALAHRFGIPSVTGFLLAGVATGPHGLGLIASPDSVAEVSELGVVLLLFTIGLELSLSRLLALGRELFQGGGLQVLGSATGNRSSGRQEFFAAFLEGLDAAPSACQYLRLMTARS